MTEIASDFLTIVESCGEALTKTIIPGPRITGPEVPFLVNLRTWPVNSLDDIRETLEMLQFRSQCAILRGAPVNPPEMLGVRRLLHGDAQRGPATLREALHWWVAFDIDSLPLPPNVPTADLTGCAGIARAALPSMFQCARCVAQATASHGIKPGIRMRLWFWLDRPTSDLELKHLMRGAPVDHAVFNAVQFIFTARPNFVFRMEDPIRVRIVELEGNLLVKVPPRELLLPVRAPMGGGQTIKGAPRAETHVELIRAFERIGNAQPGKRHPTLVAVCVRLARLVRNGAVSEPALREALRTQCRAIAWHDESEIEGIMTWAFTREFDDFDTESSNATR